MLDPNVKAYWQHRMDVAHGLIMKRERLVIPPPLRTDILQCLHEGHQGISKCRAKAKESVWWPGISAQIGQMVGDLEKCLKNRLQNREPMLSTSRPPMAKGWNGSV